MHTTRHVFKSIGPIEGKLWPCRVWIDEVQSDCFKKRIEAEEGETGWLPEEDMVSGENER